jgi:MFS family permease
LDNWVQQYSLICEEKWKIGLIGSVYWAGVVATAILITWLADKYGRRWVHFASYALFLIIVYLILWQNELVALYVLMFL